MHIFSDFSACCQAVWVADGNSYLKAAAFRTKISIDFPSCRAVIGFAAASAIGLRGGRIDSVSPA